MNRNKFSKIDCPLCYSSDKEFIYKVRQDTGYFGSISTSFSICLKCSFVYMNPRPNPTSIEDYYRQQTFSSDTFFHVTTTYNDIYNDRVNFYFESIKGILSGRFLEIGCSTANFLQYIDLKLQGWEKHGLEPSRYCASVAKNKGLHIINKKLEDINAIDKYDVVAAFNVLEHFYDPHLSIEKISSLLNIGGFIWLEVPDTEKLIPGIDELFHFEHLSHFTKQTLVFLLRKYGFSNFVFKNDRFDRRLYLYAKKISDGGGIIYPDKIFVKKMRHNIINYKKCKHNLEAEISNRLNTILLEAKINNLKVAIYGAGYHTSFLLSLVDFSDTLVGIIDSDQRKHGNTFKQWIIYDDSFLLQGNADIVVISSVFFQEEIYNKIKGFDNIRIIKIY